MPRLASRDTGQGLQAAEQLKSGQKSSLKVRGQNIFGLTSTESINIQIIIRLLNRWIQMDPSP